MEHCNCYLTYRLGVIQHKQYTVPSNDYTAHRKCAPTAYSRTAASLSSTAARRASGSPRSTCADTCAVQDRCNRAQL